MNDSKDHKATAEPPVECRVGRKWKDTDSLAFALECAADFLDREEWPEDDGGKQMAANREAARRIRRMARRLVHNTEVVRREASERTPS